MFHKFAIILQEKIIIYRLKAFGINGCKQDKVDGSLLCVKKITSSHEKVLMYGNFYFYFLVQST
jgi:hypothetical protein